MHEIAVLALPTVVAFDLAVPCETFARARRRDDEGNGDSLYKVVVCGPRRKISSGFFEIRVSQGLEAIERADTVIIPGIHDPDRSISPAVLSSLQSASVRGARIASICTGAFVLAEAGLLDEKRATTHWAAATELASRYPRIDVDPDVLFVDHGRLLTSAGAAAGFDLCLHMLRNDHGAAIAAQAARMAVVPLERDGGQAQFVSPDPPAPHDVESLAGLLAWIDGRLAEDLSLDAIAVEAAMSKRTLSRRFREQTGMPPAQWVGRARIRRAQQLLETTDQPVDRIAGLVGFRCQSTFRERFQRLVGQGPRAYRQLFRRKAA